MNASFVKYLAYLISFCFCTVAFSVSADDIDIFIGGKADAGLPNVVFVLDNTANWSRQSQKWPGGITQAQSEVLSIKNALSGLEDRLNVGLVMFSTQGNSDDNEGGYVRFGLQKLTSDARGRLNGILDAIYKDYDTPAEKRNAGAPYGSLMQDVYAYLGGTAQSRGGRGVPSTRVDGEAYTTPYSLFKSPLTADELCAKTYLIFIGNPQSSGPTEDDAANSSALKALYQTVSGSADRLAGDSAGTPLPLPEITTTITQSPPEILGFSGLCYSTQKKQIAESLQLCNVNERSTGLCVGRTDCFCTDVVTQSCSTNNAKFQVRVSEVEIETKPTGKENTTAGAGLNMDDWAKFLNLYGVPVGYIDNDGKPQQMRHTVSTYTIDVYNKQPNALQSGLLYSAATVGGGRYYAATNEAAIKVAIEDALSEILSVNSTFAAVTMPLSATDRAINENQVFIGMFRPDPDAMPRWFGNLKRYQINRFGGSADLADSNGRRAMNSQSGFASECAVSYWTADSEAYWEGLGVKPPPFGQCIGSTTNSWSDLPDGPFVEKGGVAQMLRMSSASSRKLLTVKNNALAAFNSSDASLIAGDMQDDAASIYNFFEGSSGGVGEITRGTGRRPSVHGDVIHSRPLPINYGGNTGTVVYYGANDGFLRAVNASNGAERWAFIAPEHYGKILRLYKNSPIVKFPNQEDAANPRPKGYFFDGSLGQFVTYNSANKVETAYVYPSMRRGGRMIYGFNVKNPDDPKLMWRVGCPNDDSDVGCSSGFNVDGVSSFSDIGQTWSTPQGAIVKGHNATSPVLVFGGGYASCEDHTTPSSSCGSGAKGRKVYVVDAVTGVPLRIFGAERSVAADVSLVDTNFDGAADFAYVADMGGSVYRINFVDPANGQSLSADEWSMEKIAYTAGGYRKFMNAPEVAAYQGSVYVALGSGNRERPLEQDYPYQSDIADRFYVFLDTPAAASSALDLDELNDSRLTVDCAGQGVYPGTTQRGWFMGLPGRGEQVVNAAAISGGTVFFNTTRPGASQTGMCTPPLGVATGYQMGLFTGWHCGNGKAEEIPGGGMPIAPNIFTTLVPDENGDVRQTTICIGCLGLDKVLEIEPQEDTTRKRVFWSSDIDR